MKSDDYMPYITKAKRAEIQLRGGLDSSSTCGDLNYYLTWVIRDYLELKGLSYQTINDISGALTECLAEFRRRIVINYEDSKIKSNGDVY